MYKAVIFITIVLMALISGFFYAYSCSVNPGLGRLSDLEYLKAMQSINKAVLNPVFFTSFFGTLVFLPIGTWVFYHKEGTTMGFLLVFIATLVYIFGVFLVTGTGNVPLNNALDKFDLARATAEELQRQRALFEKPWNRFHLIRTVANLASLSLLVWAVLNKKW